MIVLQLQPIQAPKPQPILASKEREPLSGIANTIMIRKSKRKFLVVSLNPLRCDENGNSLNSEEASHHQSIPQTVEVPIPQKQEEGTPKSTKKYDLFYHN